jgi:cell division protein ZapA (FtsZ GTPase activity inhibitor)
VVVGDDRQDRAELLLGHDRRVEVDVGDQHGQVKVAGIHLYVLQVAERLDRAPRRRASSTNARTLSSCIGCSAAPS